tara:strand:- start:44 stop:1057 length:1014 start_codon:yes stop_codon:yes gene_type:complete
MKRTFYILFSLLVLISCESRNELEGLWIGAYQIHYSGDEPVLSSMRLLLDISKDEIVYKTFDYPMFDENDSMIISKYSIDENKLIFDNDTFLIKGITNDSLVLSINSHYKRDVIFKRLPENNEKQRIDIINNAYSLIGSNYADSIDFINDSLILHIGNVFNTNYRSSKWAINSYESLDFLVFDQLESPPFLIDNSSDNEISLKLYFTTIKDFKMTKIENVKDTSGIIGNWVWPFLYRQDFPLPPPPPFYPEDGDTRLYLRITLDTLEIEQFDKIDSKKWLLNSTNEFIYFPDDLRTKYGVWKILSLNEYEFVIERNKKYHNSEDKEIVKFEKIKNSR